MTQTTAARKICLLLNKKAGTARGANIDTLAEQIAAPFRERGDSIDIRVRAPKSLGRETALLNKSDPFDLIVIGGGDGTLSRCAQDLAKNPAMLGFLPLGTMNLFARALGLPADAAAAAAAIAQGKPRRIDVGSVNGQLFLHHVSFGLHPKLVRQRDAMTHNSRVGKIMSGLRAFWLTARKPPRLNLAIGLNDHQDTRPSSAIVISNNPFGSGHLPYPDEITSGMLGVYVCRSFDPPELIRLGADAMLGRLEENPAIDSTVSKWLTLSGPGRGKSTMTASIDGELSKISLPTEIKILHAHLDVMVPRED